MPDDIASAADRFEQFAQRVLAPAIYPRTSPLDPSVFQSAEPISHAAASSATFHPVPVGWEWGPVWSTAWFRVQGAVPAALAHRRVVVRFSSGTEALAWRDGVPWQGLDLNRDSIHLFDSAPEGAHVDILIEAACNHHLGQLGTQWEPAALLERWRSARPGRLERCELAEFDESAWRLHWSCLFALRLMRELPPDSPRARELLAALDRAASLASERGPARAAPDALRVLSDALAHDSDPPHVLCHAVGHAHIDTAWLWPVRETRRKCLRTFATALRNLERFPRFLFLCSQAQHYAWVEDASPALFQEIRSRVAEGRWEPGGAMWIEADCNLVSGESLVRQILHGTRYWRSRFAEHGTQRHLYLPDTFGFCAALPQIMRLAGLDTFITHKLSWNQTTVFPHTNFLWRGLDGSEVLAHCMPGHDYNLLMTPRELRRGEHNHMNKDLSGTILARYLQPFGYGDGGGGPTDWQIYSTELARACHGVPHVVFSRADRFCDALHADRDARQQAGRDFPAWHGELYLEAHRGTFTTHAWIKNANRRAEESLRAAEILTWGNPQPLEANVARQRRAEQDQAWKLVLLNQFHDIIPGTSIDQVYRDARADHERVLATADSHITAGLARIGRRLDLSRATSPFGVFNPTPAARSAVVESNGRLCFVRNVPAIGVRVADLAVADALPHGVPPVELRGCALANGVIDAEVDPLGRVSSLRCAGWTDSLVAPGRALNELVLYDDRPRNWDAWEIDADYEHTARPVHTPPTLHAASSGPLRARVIVERPLGERSRIRQEYTLDAGSPRLDIRTTIDWHEEHTLLRALFPTSLESPIAAYDTAFGVIERPTRRDTPRERAMFEVPAHRWMDLSDPGARRGLGVLNDSKYGHSCHHGVMGLSLLRAPTFPDPTADRGVHTFVYSLMPHDACWRDAGVDDEADRLNEPLRTFPLGPSPRAASGDQWAPITIDAEPGPRPVVAALKAAEEDDRLVLRIVETRGRAGSVRVRWNIPVRDVRAVDLLERDLEGPPVSHDDHSHVTTLPLGAFKIVTLAAGRA